MPGSLFQGVARDLFRLGILAVTSLTLALLLNQFRSQPLPLIYQTKEERVILSLKKITTNQLVPTHLPSEQSEISLPEFQQYVEQKQGLVVDARPEIFYRLGHVPQAWSLPRENFDEGYAKLRERIEIDKNQRIIVYCSDISCEDSGLVQKALQALGFNRASVFRGGWAEWSHAGLPKETTQ